VTATSELKPGFKRAIQATEDGKRYLLDISNERWGKGGELTWHPDISIARMRTRAARRTWATVLARATPAIGEGRRALTRIRLRPATTG
jgi:hypothetical protein